MCVKDNTSSFTPSILYSIVLKPFILVLYKEMIFTGSSLKPLPPVFINDFPLYLNHPLMYIY